ncbi:unnamed protein product [Prunus armeniaca]
MALMRRGGDETYPLGFPTASGLPSWSWAPFASWAPNWTCERDLRGLYYLLRRGVAVHTKYLELRRLNRILEKWQGMLALVRAVLLLSQGMRVELRGLLIHLAIESICRATSSKRGIDSTSLTPLEARMATAKKVRESFALAKGHSDTRTSHPKVDKLSSA